MEDFPVKIVIVLAVLLVALSSFPLLSQSSPGARSAVPAAVPPVNLESSMATPAIVAPKRTRRVSANPVGKQDSKAVGPADRAVPRSESAAKSADEKVILQSSNPVEH